MSPNVRGMRRRSKQSYGPAVPDPLDSQPQTTRDLSHPSLNRNVRGNLSDTRPRCFVDTYHLTDWRGDTLLRELTILVGLLTPLSSARRVRPCDHGKISGDPQGGALPPSHVSDMDS